MNLPESFRRQMRVILEDDDVQAFEQALQNPSPISIRVNKQPKFPAHNPYTQLPKVPWCDCAYYLPVRPVFTLDPLLHMGGYYVQEAASMYLEQCVKHIVNEYNAPQVVLDLCAAPGGKSTHLLSLLPNDSLLISNEIIRSRANILHENVTKWGASNTVITNNDPKDFAALSGFFDIILVDAPCSGEGMFRKDAGAINEWSEGNVRLCAERQRRILANVWAALKPNGYLIYSTCTYNTAENEDNMCWLINEFDATSVPIIAPETEGWGISPSFTDVINAARFFPHKTQGEGLFISVLRKSDTNMPKIRFKKDKSQYQKVNKEFTHVTKWLNALNDKSFVQSNNSIYALPSTYLTEIELLNKQLKVISAGIAIGEIKGSTIIPSTALALNCEINTSEFITKDIDLETALNYLRRNNINVSADTPKGYILLTYNNIPLGWIKNLGNRSNNLYPTEWRIRHL